MENLTHLTTENAPKVLGNFMMESVIVILGLVFGGLIGSLFGKIGSLVGGICGLLIGLIIVATSI